MLSWVVLDRAVEEKVASDPKWRKRTAGKPLRSDAKPLTDEELLAKLRYFDIALDRVSLERLCQDSLSAEEIAKSFIEKRASDLKGRNELDWIWICLDALWQRWFPNKPSFEMLDDKIQTGYKIADSDSVAGCNLWLEAWNDVLYFLDKTGIQSIDEFDNLYEGTQSLFNWVQDLEIELWNTGLKNREFLTARIALCEETLKRFESEDDLMTENFRRDMAETYYELGETIKAETLFNDWLNTDPQWGWGWIGWSDCYQSTRQEVKNLQRAEEILLKGLSIAEVRDFDDIAERLSDLYYDQGRLDKAEEIDLQARNHRRSIRERTEVLADGNVFRHKTVMTFEDEGLPLSELPALASLHQPPATQANIGKRKIGRNEPCPCGSGRKYKKCCL